MSGRPLRRRADHSWPQRRQLYHAITQVLSGAGSTGRPQKGHDVAAVTWNVLDMLMRKATIVPLRHGRQALRELPGATVERGIPSNRAGNSAPEDAERPEIWA